MSEDKKSISINQRIPLNVLESALKALLNDDYSDQYIKELLSIEFSGDNRLKKAVVIVNKIIKNSPHKEFVISNKDEILNAFKQKNNRNVILISLLNLSYNFSFTILQIFGKYFTAQDEIKAEIVKKKASAIYGGNRVLENGLYSVIPMYLEAKLFLRSVQGIYHFEKPLPISSKIVKELYIKSFLINSKFDEVQEYQMTDPYFKFIEF